MDSLEREMAPDLGTRQPSGLRKPAFVALSADAKPPPELFFYFSTDLQAGASLLVHAEDSSLRLLIVKKSLAQTAPAHRSRKAGSLLLWMQARNE